MTFSEARQQSQIELTPEEMLEISQEINRKFAPSAASFITDVVDPAPDESRLYPFGRSPKHNLKTISSARKDSHNELSPKELYEISREISRRYPPKDETARPELLLLPVDPYHLYAYWNLGRNQEQAASPRNAGKGLTLRIYWLPNESNEITGSNVWFDVPVHEPNARQKVRLPLDDAAYSAALGKLKPNHDFEAYEYSNIIRVPRGRTKTTPFQSRDGKAVHGGNAAVMPLARKNSPNVVQDTAEAPFRESTLMDRVLGKQEHGRHLIGEGWYAELHFRHSANREIRPVRIGARIADLIKEPDIDIQLFPEPMFTETIPCPRKNASGSGIREDK
ncbi:MAG: DUF4912 domain-containing protein [Methylosarcina sp.]